MGLGIHKYQDQIQELSGQVTQPIKDALELLGLPWIQNRLYRLDFCRLGQKLVGYGIGIGMFLLGGKLATILTDFFDFSKLCFLISGTAVLVDLGIHTYNDGWQLSLLYLTEPESEE